MKIALFSDIHGKTQHLKKIESELKAVDLVVVCGDITHFGNMVSARVILGAFENFNPSIMSVAGNCDLPEVEQALKKDDIQLFQGINFILIGGSLITPSKTPNEHYEQYYEQILNNCEKKLQDNKRPFILISHQPPYGVGADRVANGLHVGSKIIRGFIERTKPLACLTGHIHEGRSIDRIGSTVVINPGPFLEGCYAVIEIPFIPCEVRCELKLINVL